MFQLRRGLSNRQAGVRDDPHGLPTLTTRNVNRSPSASRTETYSPTWNAWSPKRKPSSSSSRDAGRLPFEGPGRAAAAAGAMDEQALHRRLARPEAVGEAFAAMGFPGLEVDVAVLGQGRDEVVAVADRPFRELFRPRRLKRDLAQRRVVRSAHQFLSPPLPPALATRARLMTISYRSAPNANGRAFELNRLFAMPTDRPTIACRKA